MLKNNIQNKWMIKCISLIDSLKKKEISSIGRASVLHTAG